MFEKLSDLPVGIDGLKAIGKLTREDYQTVLEPLLDEARQEGRRLRVLCELGADFEGVTPSAMWEDTKVGLRYLRLLDGFAITTDFAWVRDTTNVARFFLPFPVRVFGMEQRAEAITWLKSLPEHANISQRLLPESGVIVVEVHGPLNTKDFDALTSTADAWIEMHGELQGIVIRTREFPGWENLALFRHVRFVRNHHRKVKRIALAADTAIATLAPRIGERLSAFENRHS